MQMVSLFHRDICVLSYLSQLPTLFPVPSMTGSSSFKHQLKSHFREHFLTTHPKPPPCLLYLVSLFLSFMELNHNLELPCLFTIYLELMFTWNASAIGDAEILPDMFTALSSVPSLVPAHSLGSAFTERTNHY